MWHKHFHRVGQHIFQLVVALSSYKATECRTIQSLQHHTKHTLEPNVSLKIIERAGGRARAFRSLKIFCVYGNVHSGTLSSRLNANACSHLFQHIEARNIQFLLPDSEFGVYKVKLVSVAFAPMPVVAAAAAHTKTNPNS